MYNLDLSKPQALAVRSTEMGDIDALAEKLPPLVEQAAMLIEQADEDWNFDFTNHPLEDVDYELTMALDCQAELEAVKAEHTQIAAQIEALRAKIDELDMLAEQADVDHALGIVSEAVAELTARKSQAQ